MKNEKNECIYCSEKVKSLNQELEIEASKKESDENYVKLHNELEYKEKIVSDLE